FLQIAREVENPPSWRAAEMENTSRKWRFKGSEDGVDTATGITRVWEVLTRVMDHLNPDDRRTLIHLDQADPSSYTSFRTTTLAVDAVVDALRLASFNGYAPQRHSLHPKVSQRSN
ncbi:zinc-finger protein, partial [Dionaea muscipula]